MPTWQYIRLPLPVCNLWSGSKPPHASSTPQPSQATSHANRYMSSGVAHPGRDFSSLAPHWPNELSLPPPLRVTPQPIVN